MQIRRAEEKDIPSIDKLLNEVNMVHHVIRPDLFNINRKYTDKQLREIIADDTKPIFVATDDKDQLVGYCMTQFQQILGDTIRTEIKTLYIDDLCVDEAVRGQHIGQNLYEYTKEFAKNHGFYNITLHVWAGNDNAQKFYERMGLVPQYTCLEQIL